MYTPLESQYDVRMSGKLLLIYWYNFHVLSNLLLIYICKLHWRINKALDEIDPAERDAVILQSHMGKLLLIYICNSHVLSDLLLIYIFKLHWNLNTMFVGIVKKLIQDCGMLS